MCGKGKSRGLQPQQGLSLPVLAPGSRDHMQGPEGGCQEPLPEGMRRGAGSWEEQDWGELTASSEGLRCYHPEGLNSVNTLPDLEAGSSPEAPLDDAACRF